MVSQWRQMLRNHVETLKDGGISVDIFELWFRRNYQSLIEDEDLEAKVVNIELALTILQDDLKVAHKSFMESLG